MLCVGALELKEQVIVWGAVLPFPRCRVGMSVPAQLTGRPGNDWQDRSAESVVVRPQQCRLP